VFTARYALSPYIKQIHSVFKGLKYFNWRSCSYTINWKLGWQLQIWGWFIVTPDIQGVSFIVTPSTTALSLRKPVPAVASHDGCGVQDSDKRNVLYFSMMKRQHEYDQLLLRINAMLWCQDWYNDFNIFISIFNYHWRRIVNFDCMCI
jgi:hypothetical protein